MAGSQVWGVGHMRKYLIPVLIAASVAVPAAGALAKPHDIRSELKREVLFSIHAPTGCVAAVEYYDGSFVQAFITDPLCLPKGVSKRYIPASIADFYSLDPQQAAIIDQ